MTAQQATEALFALPRIGEGGATLTRMEELLHRLGDPQKQLKCIHIAGTNGKGTTATLTASILTHAGYKTGLTISPFVLEFRERFQIDGEMIPKRVFSSLAGKVLAAAEEMQQEGNCPGQFEAVTALAVLWFAKESCDFAVLETGLGGRYDATNAVGNTLVAAITKIGYDHTELLGDTLEKIAAEKAGILKEGCTVVCYPEQPKEALGEILAESARKNCTWVMPELTDFEFFPNKAFRNKFDYGGYTVELPFPGRHQCLNAAVAIEICLALWKQGYEIEDEAILEGLQTAFLPARQEVISRHPLVVLDGCHNLDGVTALAAQLQPITDNGGRVVCLMGAMGDKDIDKMLETLEPAVDKVYAAAPDYYRSMSADALAEKAKFYFDVETCPSVKEGVVRLLEEEADAYVVCGSLYLAAEARPALLKLCR